MRTAANLKEAFAGESQASQKYRAFARKAELDGMPNVARLFRTAAEAEIIHAQGHFRSMEGVGTTADNLKAAIDGATGKEIHRAWATALALTWLHLHAADVEDQWRLLGRKAQRWLDEVPARAAGGASWMDAARRFLSA